MPLFPELKEKVFAELTRLSATNLDEKVFAVYNTPGTPTAMSETILFMVSKDALEGNFNPDTFLGRFIAIRPPVMKDGLAAGFYEALVAGQEIGPAPTITATEVDDELGELMYNYLCYGILPAEWTE